MYFQLLCRAAFVLSALILSSAALAQSQLRILHAAPFAADVDATSVTVAANGTALATDFRFQDFTDLLEVPAGDYTVTVTPTGGSEAAITADVTLEDGVSYTVLAIGNGTTQPLELLALDDTVDAPDAGNLNLRIVHAAPFAADLAATEVSIRTASGDVVNNLVGVPYKGESGFFQIPAGTYDLKVASNDGLTNLIDPLPVALPAEINLTVVAVGDGINQALGIVALPVGVLATRTPVDFSATGWWNSLNTSNEGYIIQAIPSRNAIAGTIYTYDPAGSGDTLWFTFQGDFDGRQSTATVFSISGGEFAGQVPADVVPIGTVDLIFEDCDNATATINLDDMTNFTWDLGRLIEGSECTITPIQ
ncbi:MAG: DUF4397 domain-containing protein [Pseudomonadota bacterium]